MAETQASKGLLSSVGWAKQNPQNGDDEAITRKEESLVGASHKDTNGTNTEDSDNNRGKLQNFQENVRPEESSIAVNYERKAFSWWFWSSNDNVEANRRSNINIIDEATTAVNADKSEVPQGTNSLFSYIYSNTTNQGSSDEQTPLLENDRLAQAPKSDNLDFNSRGSWGSYIFSWIWPANKDEESYEGSNDPELYRSAKCAIESPKETSHYALHTRGSTAITNDEFELAVSGTKTESLPVKNKSHKKPITPNEIQERSLQPIGSSSLKDDRCDHSIGNDLLMNDQPSLMALLGRHLKESSIIPSLEESYRVITCRTRLRLFGEHMFRQNKSSESHIYRENYAVIKTRRKEVKKIVVIGIHGFLPLKMVKTLIGESTGSSARFVEEANKAVRSWLKIFSKGKEAEEEFDIQNISLDGKGKIEERVEKLYKLLENWKDTISSCDFLFVVSHSLGTPISIHLLAKLLDLSFNPHVNPRKKVGLLCMSGMFMGPFTGLDSKLIIRAFTSHENEIINELFEFQKQNSHQSVKLIESLKFLMNHNVKVTLAASIDDQFVPLSSALAMNIEHPNIFRVIYIDDGCEVPAFLITLMKVLLLLFNLGKSDHGIILAISDRFMGSVPTGGHVKIYKDQNVYFTAIRHALETTDLVHARSPKLISRSHWDLENYPASLYRLPWKLRGIVAELIRLKSIDATSLLRGLVENYHSWDSSQKKWKEFKLCFEAFDNLDLDDIYM